MVLLAVLMCACGTSGTKSEKKSSVSEETKEKEEKTPEPEKEVEFESFAAFDNEEVSVTVKELDPKNIWGYTIKLGLENKSASTTYMFSVEDVTVNGVGVSSLFADEVAPSKKANEEVVLATDDLKKNGITEYTDIEVFMRIYDSDDWSADPIVQGSFHIYPLGEDKATRFVRDAQSTDTVLADNDKVSVIVTGYTDDSIWGYTVNLYLVNKTDQNLMYAVEDASVNGYMLDPFYANSLRPGTCEFSSMSWSDSKLEENDITDIESIEFKLRVYDAENWFDSNVLEEVYTLKP